MTRSRHRMPGYVSATVYAMRHNVASEAVRDMIRHKELEGYVSTEGRYYVKTKQTEPKPEPLHVVPEKELPTIHLYVDEAAIIMTLFLSSTVHALYTDLAAILPDETREHWREIFPRYAEVNEVLGTWAVKKGIIE